jgi:hypothetical protein
MHISSIIVFPAINLKKKISGMAEISEKLKSGPRDGLTYPLHLKYCGNCSMPIEVSKFDWAANEQRFYKYPTRHV